MRKLNKSDWVVDKIWLGPEKGNKIRLRHLPTGLTAESRVISPSENIDKASKEETEKLINQIIIELKNN